MRLLLGIGLASLCCLATAADSPQVTAARRLVEFLQIEQMYQDADAACRVNWNSAGAALAAYQDSPEQFGGISPKSAHWNEVETLFEAYRTDACGASDIKAMKEIYVQVFANRLSQADLESASAYADTPLGRALQTASREAARVLMAYNIERQEQDVARAGSRFRQGIDKLKASYSAAPR